MAGTTGTSSIKNMVDIDGALSSNVDGYEGFGILYSQDFSFSTTIGAGAGGLLDTSAQIKATPLVIKIASGVYIPTMETHFIQGTPFLKINIAKLANVNGTNQLRETILFENCYILKMSPSNDVKTAMNYNTLTLRFTKYTDTLYAYDDITGGLLGKTESIYDFSKNITA